MKPKSERRLGKNPKSRYHVRSAIHLKWKQYFALRLHLLRVRVLRRAATAEVAVQVAEILESESLK
jgi:hypothetical protein